MICAKASIAAWASLIPPSCVTSFLAFCNRPSDTASLGSTGATASGAGAAGALAFFLAARIDLTLLIGPPLSCCPLQ